MVQDNELGERGMRSMVPLEQGESPLHPWLETWIVLRCDVIFSNTNPPHCRWVAEQERSMKSGGNWLYTW